MNSRSTLGVSTLGDEGSVKCPHKLTATVVKYWLNLIADNFSVSAAVLSDSRHFRNTEGFLIYRSVKD